MWQSIKSKKLICEFFSSVQQKVLSNQNLESYIEEQINSNVVAASTNNSNREL